MKNQIKKFSQYIKESRDGDRTIQAAIIFDPNTGNLEVMFGNYMHDYHGLEDAANEGNEVHIVEYDPEDGGIYLYNGKLDLSGVHVIKTIDPSLSNQRDIHVAGSEDLVVHVDPESSISNEDIREILQLNPRQKVKLVGAVETIASGLYGDLPRRKSNIYTVEEIREWLDNIR